MLLPLSLLKGQNIYKSFYAPINAEVASVVVDEYDLFDNEPAEDEFKDYCSKSVRLSGVQNQDILLWWKANSKTYPNLSRMARDYLAIPGTSASLGFRTNRIYFRINESNILTNEYFSVLNEP
jgi:hypothetical protein